jgi:hypothetical protein
VRELIIKLARVSPKGTCSGGLKEDSASSFTCEAFGFSGFRDWKWEPSLGDEHLELLCSICEVVNKEAFLSDDLI